MFESPTYTVEDFFDADLRRCPPSIMFTETQHLAIHGQKGFVKTELLRFSDDGPTIGRVQSTGHEIALREEDKITLLAPRTGLLDVRVGGREFRIHSRHGMAFRPTDRRTRALPGPAGRFSAVTLQVPVRRLLDLAQSGHVSGAAALSDDVFALDGLAGERMTRILPVLSDDLFLRPHLPVPPRVASEIGHLIDEQLCEILDMRAAIQSSRRIFPAFHRVRQALEILHDCSDEAVSLLGIARRLGVSHRSLQLAFKEIYDGLSARDALKGIRLQKARARLLTADAGTEVTTAAFDSGFFHLGRFAQAYRAAFGESPSQTLNRSRTGSRAA